MSGIIRQKPSAGLDKNSAGAAVKATGASVCKITGFGDTGGSVGVALKNATGEFRLTGVNGTPLTAISDA